MSAPFVIEWDLPMERRIAVETRPIVALIYDFDKTLSPKDMQEYSFLPGINVRPDDFWAACREFAVKHRTDGVLAYMYMMQHKARGSMLLTRRTLNELGAKIEFFPGVVTWFDRINRIGAGQGVQVEHYIISSGLSEIIEGTQIAGAFKAVFGASFVYDESGVAIWPATAVNYTSKTQYLFRINKGILDVTNDKDLNGFTPEHARRVPFTNMIYIGDGLTDVPCMKLTKLKGGYSIAVHQAGDTDMVDSMLLQGRVDFALPADYSEGSEMERTVSAVIRRMRARMDCDGLHRTQYERAAKRVRGEVPDIYDE